MAVTGMRRLTFSEQASRNRDFRGRGLAIEVPGQKGFGSRAVEVIKNLPALLAVKGLEMKFYTPLGIEMNAGALIGKTALEMDEMAAQIDAISQAALGRKAQVELPEMIDMGAYRIMKGEVTVTLYNQVMGIEIS